MENIPSNVLLSGDKWEIRVLQKWHHGKFLAFNLQSGSIPRVFSCISLEIWNLWVMLSTHTPDTEMFAALPQAHKLEEGSEDGTEDVERVWRLNIPHTRARDVLVGKNTLVLIWGRDFCFHNCWQPTWCQTRAGRGLDTESSHPLISDGNANVSERCHFP